MENTLLRSLPIFFKIVSMGFSVVSVAFVVMNKSVQELMDERMCRPGYRWNSTLKRCLAMGGGDGEPTPPEETIVPEPEVTTPGRGDVRVNANGVKQTGTKMGKGMPIK